jgi:hypothetical protein
VKARDEVLLVHPAGSPPPRVCFDSLPDRVESKRGIRRFNMGGEVLAKRRALSSISPSLVSVYRFPLRALSPLVT